MVESKAVGQAAPKLAPKPKRHELEASWDKVARKLVELEEAWKEHQALYLDGRREIESLSPGYQKHLAANFNLSRFSVALPRIVDYCRGIGGFENLIVKEANDGT